MLGGVLMCSAARGQAGRIGGWFSARLLAVGGAGPGWARRRLRQVATRPDLGVRHFCCIGWQDVAPDPIVPCCPRWLPLTRVRQGVLVSGIRKAAGSAALVLVEGAVPLRPEPALFDAMLEGWSRQQSARRLTVPLIDGRVRLVRRFAAFTGDWPWQWTSAQAEQWIASGGWAHSTIRSYEGALTVFLGYVRDPRYGWIAECEQQTGTRPVQVFHEGNPAVHTSDYEGRPQRRPLARAELQAFLDAADDHVWRAESSGRKGWLAAFR